REALRQMGDLPNGTEPRIKWFGWDLPGEISEGNFLTAGAIGTGKTRIHRELMGSICPSIRRGGDRRMLIYDVKCDLLGELFTMDLHSEVLVFNPFDKRFVAWDIAADISKPEEETHFAEALIPLSNDPDKDFFPKAARTIITEVTKSLNGFAPGAWTLRH